jgi:hypothetical protein
VQGYFYECDGEKVGPVPAATLGHLLKTGVITQQSKIWLPNSDNPTLASQLPDTTFIGELANRQDAPSPVDVAMSYLKEVLDAYCEERADLLSEQSPLNLGLLDDFSVGHVLIDYQILSLAERPHHPPEPGVRPIRRFFQAIVELGLCERPSTRESLANLRRTRPGFHRKITVFEGREFDDGTWLFMDESFIKP